jgi:hypothetical protein
MPGCIPGMLYGRIYDLLINQPNTHGFQGFK